MSFSIESFTIPKPPLHCCILPKSLMPFDTTWCFIYSLYSLMPSSCIMLVEQSCSTFETAIWSHLLGMCWQVFKRQMDLFLDHLFKCLACDHQLCRTAAGKCAAALRDFVGPGIFAGHLSEAQSAAMSSSPDVSPPSGRVLCELTPDVS